MAREEACGELGEDVINKLDQSKSAIGLCHPLRETPELDGTEACRRQLHHVLGNRPFDRIEDVRDRALPALA